MDRSNCVYLSDPAASQLAAAVARRGVAKSTLIEAALDCFLKSDGEVGGSVTVAERLSELSRQLGRLDHDLKIVSETVALHARFHLAVTAPVSAAIQRGACEQGVERFEEFATQVGRRVDLGTSLMGETMDRLRAKTSRDRTDACGAACKADLRVSTSVDAPSKRFAASWKVFRNGRAFHFIETAANPETIGGTTEVDQHSLAGTRYGPPKARRAAPTEYRTLIMRVFLPFVVGYYLSFLFRTINALIAAPLASELGLGADRLGLLTSVYFLAFAAAQIPIGILLDRYGPRRIQSALLVVAACGTVLFAASNEFLALLAARALIGLGVAASLTAGLKALVLWFPRERLVFFNGLMVMLGALGAVTATSPTELLLAWIGWRQLFVLFAAVTAGCALLIYLVVPKMASETAISEEGAFATLTRIYSDSRFWRLAPISTTSVGTAWALQGLWAAQWLTDVEGLDRAELVHHLLAMAVAVSLGAVFLGFLASLLRKRGVGPETLLGIVAFVFITTQFAIIARWPLPSYILWGVVAAIGAATVLSYAALAELFPKQIAGRANGALNVLHVGGAFVLQYSIGLVLQHWPPNAGHYPEIAYQTAFALNLGLQIVAWIWFALPRTRPLSRKKAHTN